MECSAIKSTGVGIRYYWGNSKRNAGGSTLIVFLIDLNDLNRQALDDLDTFRALHQLDLVDAWSCEAVISRDAPYDIGCLALSKQPDFAIKQDDTT